MLRTQLARLEATEADLTRIDKALRAVVAPHDPHIGLLMTLPGINRLNVIGEIGVDMSAFHSADHLAAWTGLCPGNNESAGKQRSGKLRKDNLVLKTILVNAAIAGSGTRGH